MRAKLLDVCMLREIIILQKESCQIKLSESLSGLQWYLQVLYLRFNLCATGDKAIIGSSPTLCRSCLLLGNGSKNAGQTSASIFH